jgi:hypothetical protein
MNALEGIGKILQTHNEDSEIPWEFTAALAITSNLLDGCRTDEDLESAIRAGGDLYENGTVTDDELRYCMSMVNELATKFVKRVRGNMKRISELN